MERRFKMIFQSPESDMPEPYKTYVRHRNDSISDVLGDVVGEEDVQLCPRAILEEERAVDGTSIVYGAVVPSVEDGHKSILYKDGLRNVSKVGLATQDYTEAERFVVTELERGNRVRAKDPKESDGNGQHVLEGVDDLDKIFAETTSDSSSEIVLMPHLQEISHRVSVGYIDLGRFGVFGYLGNEQTVNHRGNEVYGGTEIGLFAANNTENMDLAEEALEIPSALTELGRRAIKAYDQIVLHLGRVSVDVVQGIMDNGDMVQSAIDITPRVGGVTPAEVLAIREVSKSPDSICFARSRLLYDPEEKPLSGSNFLEAEELIINAEIRELVI